MQVDILKSNQQNSIEKENDSLKKEVHRLESENQLLRQRVDYLLKKYFGGKKTEKLDPNQLELLLKGLEELNIPKNTKEEQETQKKRSFADKSEKETRQPRKLPGNLPTEEIVIEPEEVKQNPEMYKCIGEERTEELDVTPQSFKRRVYVRKKYVKKEQIDATPIIEKLPARIIEGSIASPGLLTHIILNKYMDHLPLYRQEQIFKQRHGIEISRKTMSDWMDCTANWLKPIYNFIRDELKQCDFLQIDETPVRYINAKEGGSKKGYFWVYHSPGGYIIYEWHTSRASTCLDEMLKDYKGIIQTDAYSAYSCFAKDNNLITLLLCWAHSRRKFHEAIDEDPKLAGWFIRQIQHLYAIEAKLRKTKASPSIREAVRQSESQMILNRIEKALKLKINKYRPQSFMGKAMAYTFNDWGKFKEYIYHGKAEIDNNLVENAIRPTAIGKKNWLFIGHPEAGEKSAILYTILENCKHFKINMQEYLQDVLTRLPSTNLKEIKNLTPLNWIKSRFQTRKAA